MSVAPVLAACTSWKVQSVSPAQAIEARQSDWVRVTVPSGMVVLRSPRIAGDSLLGEDQAFQPVGFPTREITRIEFSLSGTTEKWVGGFVTWKGQSVSPAQALEGRPSGWVRVTAPSGRVMLYSPRISGDSVLGEDQARRPAGVPIREITGIEIKSFNAAMTLGLVAGVGVTFLAIFAQIVASSANN